MKKNNETVQLKIFKRSGAKYEEVASDYLALSSTRRSIGFLAPNRNRVRLKRYYFNKTPIESSIGFDSEPFTKYWMMNRKIIQTTLWVRNKF